MIRTSFSTNDTDVQHSLSFEPFFTITIGLQKSSGEVRIQRCPLCPVLVPHHLFKFLLALCKLISTRAQFVGSSTQVQAQLGETPQGTTILGTLFVCHLV